MSQCDELVNVRVIFRKFLEGDVIALFPEEAYSFDSVSTCMSYMHVGQHGPADLDGIAECTRPATPEEYQPLLDELTSLEYVVTVVKRSTYRMQQIREKQIVDWHRLSNYEE